MIYIMYGTNKPTDTKIKIKIRLSDNLILHPDIHPE